jgi:hypothetical protein
MNNLIFSNSRTERFEPIDLTLDKKLSLLPLTRKRTSVEAFDCPRIAWRILRF